MGTAADSAIARQRLLDAACEAFAEYGYRRATVRDICARAGVNLSAVNYHFGSKRELYAEVLRLAEPPIPSRANLSPGSEGLEPEQRLALFIRFFLAETLGRAEASWTARVLANELANPTDLLDGMVRETITPHFHRLREIVGELLGPGADHQLIDDHAFSTVSQVVFYRHSRPIIERVAERAYGADDMERLSKHILKAVLAALAAERERLQSDVASAEPVTDS